MEIEREVEVLKHLQSETDILAAVIDLSKRTDGQVMILLEKDPKRPFGETFYIHPLLLQMDAEKEIKLSNPDNKFMEMIYFGGNRITEVTLLHEYIASSPTYLSPVARKQDAAQRFAAERGFIENDNLPYTYRRITPQ